MIRNLADECAADIWTHMSIGGGIAVSFIALSSAAAIIGFCYCLFRGGW